MAGKFKMPSIQDIEKVNEEHGGAKGKFRIGAGLLNDASKDCVMMDISNIPREKIIKTREIRTQSSELRNWQNQSNGLVYCSHCMSMIRIWKLELISYLVVSED